MRNRKTGVKSRRKAAVTAVLICLLAITIPLQYLVRREVVVGLPSDAAHSHAHGEEEDVHTHEHSGQERHVHEHPDDEGHLATEVALGVNLIPNHGFEVGTREKVWGWLRVANDQGAVSYRDEAVSRRGFASAAVYAGEISVEGAGWITRLDELPLDHVVVVEGYVKTDLLQGEAYLAVMYEFEAGGSQREIAAAYTPGIGGNSDWTEVSVGCYIPPGAVGVYILAQVFGQGRAWFDDLSLVVEEKAGSVDGG
jgi:hypothetical protein